MKDGTSSRDLRFGVGLGKVPQRSAKLGLSDPKTNLYKKGGKRPPNKVFPVKETGLFGTF